MAKAIAKFYKYPKATDLFLVLIFVLLNGSFRFFEFKSLMLDRSDILDVLNELIALSLPTGAIVLAAMAIATGTREKITSRDRANVVNTPVNRILANDRMYDDLIGTINYSAFIFFFLFVFFIALRVGSSYLPGAVFVGLFSAGVAVMSSAYIRSIDIIYVFARNAGNESK